MGKDKEIQAVEQNKYQQLKDQAFKKYLEMKKINGGGKVQYNSAMITNKVLLENLIASYKDELGPKNCKDLKPAFDKLQKYINMNKYGVNLFENRKEQRLFQDSLKTLYDYSDNVFKQINSGSAKTELYSDLQDKKLEVVANLANFLEITAKGALVTDSKNARFVDATRTKFATKYNSKMVDMSQTPLFTHDPSPEDIQQGAIGDCYFISALSRIALEHPEKIRESIVDNDNGTVTVRLFTKPPYDPKNPESNPDLVPVFVTVDKSVPETGTAAENLWVQMFEKAYAASGIRIGSPYSGQTVPGDMDMLYEHYKAHPEQTPSHLECPWLVDSDGTLHKWEAHYADIAGGFPSQAVESLLGNDFRGTLLHPSLFEKDEKNKPAKYSGQYSEAENKTWELLNSASRDGSIINAGSKSKTMEGIADGHAYSVVETYTKKMGGKDLRFVKLRNPWGEQQGHRSTSPIYEVNGKNQVIVSHRPHKTDGFVEIELSDFVNSFAALDINGSKDNIEKYNNKYVDKTYFKENLPVSNTTVKEYAKVIHELKKEMSMTGRRPEAEDREFLNLFEELSIADRRSASRIGLSKGQFLGNLHSLYSTSTEYLESCEKFPDFAKRQGADRIKIAKAIKDLYQRATVMQPDEKEAEITHKPRKLFRYSIADKLYNAMLENLSKDPKDHDKKAYYEANSTHIVYTIMKNPKFKGILDSMSFSKLVELDSSKPENILKTFNVIRKDKDPVLENDPEEKTKEVEKALYGAKMIKEAKKEDIKKAILVGKAVSDLDNLVKPHIQQAVIDKAKISAKEKEIFDKIAKRFEEYRKEDEELARQEEAKRKAIRERNQKKQAEKQQKKVEEKPEEKDKQKQEVKPEEKNIQKQEVKPEEKNKQKQDIKPEEKDKQKQDIKPEEKDKQKQEVKPEEKNEKEPVLQEDSQDDIYKKFNDRLDSIERSSVINPQLSGLEKGLLEAQMTLSAAFNGSNGQMNKECVEAGARLMTYVTISNICNTKGIDQKTIDRLTDPKNIEKCVNDLLVKRPGEDSSYAERVTKALCGDKKDHVLTLENRDIFDAMIKDMRENNKIAQKSQVVKQKAFEAKKIQPQQPKIKAGMSIAM